MKNLFIVTVTGGGASFVGGENHWMKANSCMRVGDNCFLIQSKMGPVETQAKFLELVPNNSKVNVFPIKFPFIYQNDQVFEENLDHVLK